jgi:hypothetical protein
MNTRTSLITVTSLTATFVALTAAFFSVTGIAKLFAGATFSVLIMASALELGKIVSISFLYQYWEKIPKLLKTYLTIASVILMLITSVGIYGFLSGAYQITADKMSVLDSRVQIVELRKNRLQEELTLSLQERDRLSLSTQELSRGLSNNIVQYRDQQTGQIMNTTSAANRTALQRQLETANAQKTKLGTKIEQLSDSISSLEIQIVESRAGDELAAEIGPLRFISEVTGWEINKVVNIFALMLVLVFDPLAVSLVIAVNFLLKNKDDEVVSTAMNNTTTEKVSPPAKILETPTIIQETQTVPDIISKTPTITNVPIDSPKIDTPTDYHRTDNQYFTRGDFDWSNRALWENNPIAVSYYNDRVKHYLKGLDK